MKQFMKLTVVIIKVYHSNHVHTEYQPTFFTQC